MRNPEEAAKALNLNGIPYLGNVLKMVGKWRECAAHFGRELSVVFGCVSSKERPLLLSVRLVLKHFFFNSMRYCRCCCCS